MVDEALEMSPKVSILLKGFRYGRLYGEWRNFQETQLIAKFAKKKMKEKINEISMMVSFSNKPNDASINFQNLFLIT